VRDDQDEPHAREAADQHREGGAAAHVGQDGEAARGAPARGQPRGDQRDQRPRRRPPQRAISTPTPMTVAVRILAPSSLQRAIFR